MSFAQIISADTREELLVSKFPLAQKPRLILDEEYSAASGHIFNKILEENMLGYDRANFVASHMARIAEAVYWVQDLAASAPRRDDGTRRPAVIPADKIIFDLPKSLEEPDERVRIQLDEFREFRVGGKHALLFATPAQRREAYPEMREDGHASSPYGRIASKPLSQSGDEKGKSGKGGR